MKTKISALLLAIIPFAYSCQDATEVASDVEENNSTEESYDFIDHGIARAESLFQAGLKINSDPTQIPRSIRNDGSIHLVKPKDWTSGFYAGSMWKLYEATGKEEWKERAQTWTAALEDIQYRAVTHDVGFMIYCSYGNGYRLTGDTSYLPVIHQTGKTLAKRFRSTVGCTKSWNKYKFSEKWQYPVIIDNMMNLELLYFCGSQFGDTTLFSLAKTHAETTDANHFRDNHSSYHVLDYDSITGEVIQKNTHQGIADSSSWARGQGWGLYGFTYSFRETKDSRFLARAHGIANYIMTSKYLPEDKIPLWDYQDPRGLKAPRDASAAALTASALLELSGLTSDSELAKSYVDFAEDILRTLSSDAYLNVPGENHNFVLLHCTGNHPKGTEIDKPLSYGDYYYLEGLIRLKAIKAAQQ